MKSRNKLPAPYISTFFKIKKAMINHDRQGRLTTENRNILNCYKSYNSHFANNTLCNITAYTFLPLLQDDMKHCYDGNTFHLKKLKLRIKHNQSSVLKLVCPFCNIVSPDTYDHYLPKEDYPEYSVHPLNLFQCCNKCNQKKSEYWQENGTRAIINFYKDTLPNEQFLFVDITYDINDNEIPTVNFEINNDDGNVDIQLYDIIDKHFVRLDLCKRYEEASSQAISDTTIALISFIDTDDEDEIRFKINNYADNLAVSFGNNYWKSIMLKELSSEDNYIN